MALLLQWDTLLLLWLNRLVARSPGTFYTALDLSNRSPWVLATLALTWMWFSGDEGLVPFQAPYTRWEARRRVFSALAALVLGFALARVAQSLWMRPRPFMVVPLQVPIVPSDWDHIRTALGAQGAFPSDHAVMFFVVTLGLFTLSPRMGWVALMLNLFYSALRVGVGFHWPSDMLGGALIALVALGMMMFLERLWPKLWDWLVMAFYRYPGLAYPLGFLLLFDLSQKFAGFFGLLARIMGYGVAH